MSSIGIIVSAVVIVVGLLWLAVRSLTGHEVERRVIFLFIGLSVSLIFFNLPFSEKATPIVKGIYDKIDNLPSGSRILISFDYGPSMAPEVEPMSNAFIRHSLAKDHKVIIMGLWATGQSLGASAVENIVKAEFPDKVDGVDYINIG